VVEGAKQLAGRLIRELPKTDPFEGISKETVWLAKFLARAKWIEPNKFS
jgi:hypothetical protein